MFCSQNFKYGSNYGHVTFRIQKLIVEQVAFSQVKKLMVMTVYIDQIYGWMIILLLINPWVITLLGVVVCSDNVSR